MVKKIKKVAKALKKASALHKKQSKIIEKHIKEMKSYGKKRDPKKVQVKNLKDLVGGFILMRILRILLELSLQHPADARKLLQKLKRYLNHLQEKYKF